ncbi:MAG: sigma-70 family RNA polymerase sigma factor [Holophagales bacterium]|nr:sigma-70 family RNA polymerase sigma factor [Holophagales bacterium]
MPTQIETCLEDAAAQAPASVTAGPDPRVDDLTPSEVTRLLHRWRDGEAAAFERLMPLVYEELRRVAQNHMACERGSTLQATALVHEAYLRLARMDVAWNGRVHFFAVAAGAMRRILVDRARRRTADKRGGAAIAVELGEVAEVVAAEGLGQDELLALDRALSDLAGLDARKARVLELRLFGGLTIDETAEATGASTATVERDLRLGRAWVARQLQSSAGSRQNGTPVAG